MEALLALASLSCSGNYSGALPANHQPVRTWLFGNREGRGLATTAPTGAAPTASSVIRHNVLWDRPGSPDVASDCGDFDECAGSFQRTNMLQIYHGDVVHVKVYSGHNMYSVASPGAYAECIGQNPMVPTVTQSYTVQVFDSAALGWSAGSTHFAICTRSNHCDMGQKLAVSVVAQPDSNDDGCDPLVCTEGAYVADRVIGGLCIDPTNNSNNPIGNTLGGGYDVPTGYATQESCEAAPGFWVPITCESFSNTMANDPTADCTSIKLSMWAGGARAWLKPRPAS
jgi:hypothetical protein